MSNRAGTGSALEWVVQYRVSTDCAARALSTIQNREDDPEYIVRLRWPGGYRIGGDGALGW